MKHYSCIACERLVADDYDVNYCGRCGGKMLSRTPEPSGEGAMKDGAYLREHMNVWSAKLTRINSSIGCESIAEDAVICDEGTIQFPEATDNDTWGVYVPMVGFDEPFYLLFQVSESTIAMCDRKFVVTYCNAELVAALAPKEPLSFTPPQYDEDAIARDKVHWKGRHWHLVCVFEYLVRGKSNER